MGECGKGYIAIQYNPSTGKVIYDSITKKVETSICGGCNKGTLGPRSCCPLDGGSLPFYAELCLYISGIKFCSDDEIITELDNQVFCVDMEDPCEYHCYHGNYYFIIFVTGVNMVVTITNKTPMGFPGTDVYFSATVACPGALPVTIPNSLAIGDCDGNNKGYGGEVKIN